MKFNIKDYKTHKVKDYLKTNKFLIFCHGISLNLKNWVKTEQDLTKLNLNYYRSYNTLTKNSVRTSILKNLTELINGPLFFITMVEKRSMNHALKKIISVNKWLTALCIRINNKIYSVFQLKKIPTLNYIKNVIILQRFLKVLLKTPYKKFSSKQRIISK
jgi:hypothetical protein